MLRATPWPPGLPDVRFPSRWALVARDAFSGVLADWHAIATKALLDEFGERERPTVLMELMRHADIPTTMPYCVGLDAQNTAETA